MTHDSALESRVSQQEEVIRELRKEVAGLRRSSEVARQTALRYRALFDSLDAGFCVVQVLFDADERPVDYRFVDVNLAFERQTGLADAVGKTMREVVPEHEDHWFEIYGHVALTGEPRRFENPAVMLGRYYDVYAFRTGPPEQRTVGILFNDISARKRAEAAEQEAAGLKDRFFATLAHELRNPLAPLQSGLDVLRMTRGKGPASEQQVLEIMARQLGNLTRLMDELLDVAQIRQGMIALDRQRVDLTGAIRKGIELADGFLWAGDRQFSADLPTRPLTVDGDPDRLAQVVASLLENAGKFTEEEGRIRLCARRQDGKAQIIVQDDGVGIEPDMLQDIFGMFRQTSTDRQGLGLGLTVVRDLVALHGGTVEARSEGRGRGSEFVVELPLSAETPQSPPRREAPRLPALERPRMLVVDDNHDAADSLAVLLRSMGGEVRTAYDGRTALLLLDELQPQIVFLDIGMPEMDGYEVARLMRQREAGDRIVLVAVTGWGQPADRRRAAEAGFHNHLLKPATFEDLRSIVEAQHALS